MASPIKVLGVDGASTVLGGNTVLGTAAAAGPTVSHTMVVEAYSGGSAGAPGYREL